MSKAASARAAKPTAADVELVDGAFGPSKDPTAPDLVWTPLDPAKAIKAGLQPIRPWPDNPKVHDRFVSKIAASLKEFGWIRPLVANMWKGLEGELIIGHGTRLAALELKLEIAPVRFRKMAPARAHAAALADNRLAELSPWDWEKLGEIAAGPELGQPLFDLAGFDGDAFNRLLNVENGDFLNGAGGGDGDGGEGNTRPNTSGHSQLGFTLSVGDKSIVLQALSLVGDKLTPSEALVKLCKEKLRAKPK